MVDILTAELVNNSQFSTPISVICINKKNVDEDVDYERIEYISYILKEIKYFFFEK